MKTIKPFLILVILFLSSMALKAQITDKNISESVLLKTKFYRNQLFDVKRFPTYPSIFSDWKLSELNSPFDKGTNTNIDWGRSNDRYVMFSLEVDRYYKSSLLDNNSGIRYALMLNLFDRDGRFVRTISRWGKVLGLGSAGFVYEQEGDFGTFFPTDRRVKANDVVSYHVDLIEMRYVSEIAKTGRKYDTDVYQNMDNRQVEPQRYDRPDNRNSVSDCRGLMLTAGTYFETENLQNIVRREFGNSSSIADWTDLQAIPNINAWILCMGLQNEQSFMVTRNGKLTYSSNRQYNVEYFPTGRVPAGYLIHDQIGNKLFLGSWYGIKRNILVLRGNDIGQNNMRNEDIRRNDNTRRNDDVRRENNPYGNNVQSQMNLKTTFNLYSETQNLDDAVRREFAGKCVIADWTDLKAIQNIDAWINSARLQRDQTFFVTKNGKLNFTGNRQFFVLYSPSGIIPSGFLAHDQIGNKLFLGSWYGVNRQILVKEIRNY